MKRLHKRILTVCLALMMSVVMAVPAFAASYRIQSVPNSTFWNVTTYNGSVVLAPVKLEGNGCYWETIFDGSTMRLKCPYTNTMGKTLVATANSNTQGALVIGEVIEHADARSAVDIKTIGGGMSRIHFNQIDKYASASGSEVRIYNYSETNNNHKWYLHG